jgi:hypothetical protein
MAAALAGCSSVTAIDNQNDTASVTAWSMEIEMRSFQMQINLSQIIV